MEGHDPVRMRAERFDVLAHGAPHRVASMRYAT